jgi:hypothetical protein
MSNHRNQEANYKNEYHQKQNNGYFPLHIEMPFVTVGNLDYMFFATGHTITPYSIAAYNV